MPIPINGRIVKIFGKDLVWCRFSNSDHTALWNSGITERRLKLSRRELEVFINKTYRLYPIIWHGRDDSIAKFNCFKWPWLSCLVNSFEDLV